MAVSVKPKTQSNYRRAGASFYAYLEQIYRLDPTFPKLHTIINEFNLFQLDVIIREYLTLQFNTKENQGDTLRGKVCGILYCLAVDYGIALSSSLLPSLRRICKGADNMLEQWYGKKVTGKFPILNPILEAMLKVATPDEQWAILFPQRFCLRSQHYCNNVNKEELPEIPEEEEIPIEHIQIKDLRFTPNINNPNALTIITRFDKNHQNLTHMERTVYCSCGTPWTCVVHMAQKRFINNKWPLDAAAVQCRTGDMYYSAMRTIIRYLIKKIGLNPENYGTHALRSGGISELFIEGRGAIFIKNFVWYKNLNSIFIYIKPNNPDLLKFVPTFTAYRESRLRESGLSDKVDKHWEDIWKEEKEQSNKVKRSRKNSVKLTQASFLQGPVRGSLNRTSRQHRLPNRINVNKMSIKPTRHVYTDYRVRVKKPVIKPNNNPLIKTSVGMRRNPFRH